MGTPDVYMSGYTSREYIGSDVKSGEVVRIERGKGVKYWGLRPLNGCLNRRVRDDNYLQ